MKPKLKRECEFETKWINEFARTYLPSESGFEFDPQYLRTSNVSLAMLRCILRNGEVVVAEKLDVPGADWVVLGEDADENQFFVTVRVISSEQSVTLRRIERYWGTENDDDNAA